MTDDSLARNHSLAPADADYDIIHATITATERGRWFLDEYHRRHRGADTELVLTAVGRIEQAIRDGRAIDTTGNPRDEIAAIMEMIRQARRELVGRRGDPAASGEAA